MKIFTVMGLFLAGFIGVADAATPQQRRGQSTANTAATSNNAPATSARAAVSARAATRNTAPKAAPAAPTVSARAATRNTAPKAAPAAPTVSARAGTTQKVVNTGTKVATAAQNVVVNEECSKKYNGCMDSFCMLENISGGRCLCSDRYTELETVRTQISQLDSQAYQLATVGVERIEMGDAADAVIKNVQDLSQSVLSPEDKTQAKSTRKRLDTSEWLKELSGGADDDIFGLNESLPDSIDNKQGADLFRATHSLCVASIPECQTEITLLQKLYSQQIRSDCAAYENSLEKDRKSAQTKLVTAEQELRAAALEQYQNANKYDLGQCTIKFKECMATTGGCNDDFTGCVGIAAAENAQMVSTNKKAAAAQKVIKGTATQITIAASSYEALESKRPLCFETVTKNCTRVRDQVWDTFVREIAPTIKTAELLAEDNLRQSCMANISNCIANACKDTIDPNDKDGSYDLCLSRPETVESLCKVQIDPCVAAEPNIMKFVKQRLAGMRVDECTNQIKSCLQNDNRCGKDYQNCVGLSLDAMMDMCPTSQLTACSAMEGTKETRLTQYNNILQGIYLNIDNAQMKQCQDIVNKKLIEVCGDTTTCAAFDSDTTMGTESIVSYTDSNGNYVIDGLVSFNEVPTEFVYYTNQGKVVVQNSNDALYSLPALKVTKYQQNIENESEASGGVVEKITSLLNSVNSKAQQRISLLVNDPYVNRCLTGNQHADKINQNNARTEVTSHYPHILDYATSMIMTSALDRANKNYMTKYNDLVSKAVESQDDAVKAATCAAMAGTFDTDQAECTEYNTTDDGNAVCAKHTVKNPFAGILASAANGNGAGMYKTKQIINGINLQTQMALVSSGRDEYVQTDNFGNMLGRVTVAAAYQAQTNTCTLTTTTTSCANAEQVMEETEVKVKKAKTSKDAIKNDADIARMNYGDDSGANFGVSGQKIKKMNVKYERFKGVACTKFGEPVVTTQNIKM